MVEFLLWLVLIVVAWPLALLALPAVSHRVVALDTAAAGGYLRRRDPRLDRGRPPPSRAGPQRPSALSG